MVFVRILLFCILICYAASGCTIAPDIPSEDRIAMRDVVNRARCEIQLAIDKYKFDAQRGTKIEAISKKLARDYLKKNDELYPGTIFAANDLLDNEQVSEIKKNATEAYENDPKNREFKIGNFVNTLAVQFEMTLQVKDTNGIGSNAASATWGGIPIPFGTFSLKAAGGIQGTARRTAKFKVSLYLRELRSSPDSPVCDSLWTDRPSDIRLRGDFGIGEYLQRSIDTAFATDPRHFLSLGTTVSFTLTPTASIAPTWAIVRPSKRSFTDTFVLGGQRDYENTLDFVVTPIAEGGGGGGGVTRVLVTNFPAQDKQESGMRNPPTDPSRLNKIFKPTELKGRVDPLTQQRLDNELFRLQVPKTFEGR